MGEYQALSESLSRAGVLLGLPELHGAICGAMCAGGIEAARGWLEEHLEPRASIQTAPNDLDAQLDDLGGMSWQALASAQMTFEPVLPDEAAPLDEQVRALAEWCQGFLAGLGFGGLELGRAPGASSREIDEILDDFAQIGRAGLTAEDRADRNRADFAMAELKEYVRVGVQIVFEELAAAGTASASNDIH